MTSTTKTRTYKYKAEIAGLGWLEAGCWETHWGDNPITKKNITHLAGAYNQNKHQIIMLPVKLIKNVCVVAWVVTGYHGFA